MTSTIQLANHRTYRVLLSPDEVAKTLNDAGGPHGDHFVPLPLSAAIHAEQIVWVNAWQVVEVLPGD